MLLWALLPAGVLLYAFGDSGPLALLVGPRLLALVLRSTVNLSLAVLAGAVGGVTGLALVAFGGEFLDQMVSFFGEFLATWSSSCPGGDQAVVLARPTAVQIAGMMGAGNAVAAVLCLLLARYWQAALYNPGGFGEEFQALRYPAGIAMGLALARLPWPVWVLTIAPGHDLHGSAELCGTGAGTCPRASARAGHGMAYRVLPGVAVF